MKSPSSGDRAGIKLPLPCWHEQTAGSWKRRDDASLPSLFDCALSCRNTFFRGVIVSISFSSGPRILKDTRPHSTAPSLDVFELRSQFCLFYTSIDIYQASSSPSGFLLLHTQDKHGIYQQTRYGIHDIVASAIYMMHWGACIAALAVFARLSRCWPYDPDQVGYNLNENKAANSPVEYSSIWPNHTYFPSPENWRFPIYSLFLDRFVNGDPANDVVNGSVFERDVNSNQMHHGGDALGLVDSLDYLSGMGIKGIYLAGTILMNEPWGTDGYSPLDTTLLDRHFGDITMWRYAIGELHKRGMYIIMDNTLATLGDLLGFEGHLNVTVPFRRTEHKAVWKSSRRYVDFHLGEIYNETCDYPVFWNEQGYQVAPEETQMKGCYDSEFDQYGDTEAFGVYPDWQRQLTKFASVQDRLREWVPSVREKIIRHSCLMIEQLDIDGFRYDKATQATIDALADISEAYRSCARKLGKNNFFLPGEITSGNTFGAIYIGRGRQPDMLPSNLKDALLLTHANDTYFIRKRGKSALDSGAFHYSVYRSLTRFLGIDGKLAAGHDIPGDWVEGWYRMLITNDFINANTGKFDPRHMFGAENQDVFRWPAVREGVERSLLAAYIVTLHLPGIPLVLWGEEQAFYVLDNTAQNYIFGRQSMSSSPAWQTHGCYGVGSSQYHQWPLGSAAHGCHDDTVGYDHRDPSHPVRNILKTMYQMRENYPILNDGYFLQHLSKSTHDVFLPGSAGVPTETGMWSVLRNRFEATQDFGTKNIPVWLVYQNDNRTVEYTFNCTNKETALISAFDAGTVVKNLFYPFDEHTLEAGPVKLGIEGSSAFNGCLGSLQMKPWDFRAYVPKSSHIFPRPMLTSSSPRHDARIKSIVGPEEDEVLFVSLQFSEEMDCNSVTRGISIVSRTNSGKTPKIDAGSVQCSSIQPTMTKYCGELPGTWKWSAKLNGVYNGIHRLSIHNATAKDGSRNTNVLDQLLFRVGQPENPMVFTRAANYSRTLFHRHQNNDLYVSHHAAGADSFRYSTNWGSSWSQWIPYTGGNDTIEPLQWTGTKAQEWEGEHIIVEYWSRLAGSSSHVQHGDIGWSIKRPPRRFPHLFWNGPYNQFGYDAGLENVVELKDNGKWTIRFMTEWPAIAHVNVWGVNPDGKIDKSFVFGDSNADSVLDRSSPSSLKLPVVNITERPPSPYLCWEFTLDDGTLRFQLLPVGSMYPQMALFFLLLFMPLVLGFTAVFAFKWSYCYVTTNTTGVSDINSKSSIMALISTLGIKRIVKEIKGIPNLATKLVVNLTFFPSHGVPDPKFNDRRKVLIATMEYDIEDWNIKIKIGGLGVIANLMGRHLKHLDLIWVAPCVSGVDYPVHQQATPITIKLLEKDCNVKVQYHTLGNITYVLLDAPIFRQQSKSQPYPPRMDDLDSAIYYSAWNQCIAHVIKRFDIDIYHINDYHGALAPLYLLPNTIPVCLSLHNAGFQGHWAIRSKHDMEELCGVFNLSEQIARTYIQFGEVFNLLHAAASYLRIHQNGFGAVGVSDKYAKRTYKRYPIFWGLSKIGGLPNPDPQDIEDAEASDLDISTISVDPNFEACRAKEKLECQRWAGLDQDSNAELFVFVGRWSTQKGIDLIADTFTGLLEKRKNVQLICVGPIIDLYGRLAALKLHKLMEMYPNRVYSRPKFTQVPSCVQSGADFAVIPSRDEPFGLVAVEFGRKGVLGVGAKVGGLGQMPGWWYSVQSTSTRHLLYQFRRSIEMALATSPGVRGQMRAVATKQRFPVSQWVQGLEILQRETIRIHKENTSSPRLEAPKKEVLLGDQISRRSCEALLDAQRSDGFFIAPVENSGLPIHCLPLSWDSLVGKKKDFHLQQVDPCFNDETGEFTERFVRRLTNLNGRTSYTSLCIEDFLIECKKEWFGRIREAQLEGNQCATMPKGRETPGPSTSSVYSLDETLRPEMPEDQEKGYSFVDRPLSNQWFKRLMMMRCGDWPLYSFVLAFGQVIAANSYQITLITGEIGQSGEKLYAVATVYLCGSLAWWLTFRLYKSVISLSVPFFFYGMSFLFIGAAQLVHTEITARWLQNVGVGCYTFAAASGSVFFALNFGDEGGASVKDWVFRSCTIQGTQQLFIVFLWYWGSIMLKGISKGQNDGILGSWQIHSVSFPFAGFFWLIGLIIYQGVPDCYRRPRSKVPSFYMSILRRNIVLSFLLSIFLQNFFLSAPYGRNWSFLWNSKHAESWQILLLVLLFFIFIWGYMLTILKRMSQFHTWVLPVFSMGLGSPRWAQIWWGTSGIGQFLPWAGSYTSGALISRCLWLWLGVLDSAQGVGLGTVLLHTLTRVHVCFTLLAAQVIGSIATICGRALGPNNTGPGTVHPNISGGVKVLATPWFWVALFAQCMIPLLFFVFFRREQLSKP
ncbi:Cell wall alpha-1,3-glucan synthase ags1 [Ophidiomyces ophidiicola]|uniref:Cell wall alpha-1,3-glucan synthase ags1 n=1 Tax=Ophidiomyces ophidiicola TaxID=1387563 RepID=A0ACB8UX80_9EURO|nr:Cell wall alpha-1,3-glucan synthase ags1 [Ophidiomyces ophidiicola]KAI1967580.1 Cell wall alpha-1,3-glucan synthase ags1 [Ophidiomyces ophidiicola]KAI2004835.1 Cell wall alpha-1,3-glucan synthase ags1 [Ophidiomyces ophidiicola]KAI2048621.1 Cell wall alpha-1,3-glucan synthase ags1 [Ophidiomyces ophidiicola]KAI2070907.1 Cell wall alpha-1,3-glucan synthase ags1 [Ophidiomyces ophidiicola]